MPFEEDPVFPLGGPQGAQGTAGAAGTGSAGIAAFTVTAADYTEPAALGTVTVYVSNAAWMGLGQLLFIEGGGYYKVTSLISTTEIIVQATDYQDQAAPTTNIGVGAKVTPGGYTSYDAALVTSIGDRVTALESGVVYTGDEGAKTFFTATEPVAGMQEGDVWFDPATNNDMFVYDTGAWVSVKAIIDLATADITGLLSGVNIGPNTITAANIAANTITASEVVASNFISSSAMIQNGIIIDAHITTLSAAKITAGNLTAINIRHDGKIYHTDATSTYFDIANQGTSVNSSYLYAANATAWSSGGSFAPGNAVTFYGPAHASAAANPEMIICPNSDSEIIFQFNGTLNGYTGTDIAFFYRKNGAGNYAAGAYAPSGNGVSYASISGTRKWGSFASTDSIEFWVAPCNGEGIIAAPVTCSSQLDVMVQNF